MALLAALFSFVILASLSHHISASHMIGMAYFRANDTLAIVSVDPIAAKIAVVDSQLSGYTVYNADGVAVGDLYYGPFGQANQSDKNFMVVYDVKARKTVKTSKNGEGIYTLGYDPVMKKLVGFYPQYRTVDKSSVLVSIDPVSLQQKFIAVYPHNDSLYIGSDGVYDSTHGIMYMYLASGNGPDGPVMAGLSARTGKQTSRVRLEPVPDIDFQRLLFDDRTGNIYTLARNNSAADGRQLAVFDPLTGVVSIVNKKAPPLARHGLCLASTAILPSQRYIFVMSHYCDKKKRDDDSLFVVVANLDTGAIVARHDDWPTPLASLAWFDA